MKIYDIRNKTRTPTSINEGLFDMFGSDPNVHAPSREQKKQTKEREKGTKKLIDRAFDSWRDHLDQVKATLPDDYKGEIPPERVKADLQTFIQNNIMGGGQISQAANAADITHYIDKLSGVETSQEEPIGQVKTDNFAGIKSGKGTTATSAPDATTTTQEPATEPTGEEPAVEPTEPQQEPILKDPNVASSGVVRTNDNPLVLKYNRKEYEWNNDKKAWLALGDAKAKPVEGGLKSLLNTASREFVANDEILGINPPEPPPDPSATMQWIEDPATGERVLRPRATVQQDGSPPPEAMKSMGAYKDWLRQQVAAGVMTTQDAQAALAKFREQPEEEEWTQEELQRLQTMFTPQKGENDEQLLSRAHAELEKMVQDGEMSRENADNVYANAYEQIMGQPTQQVNTNPAPVAPTNPTTPTSTAVKQTLAPSGFKNWVQGSGTVQRESLKMTLRRRIADGELSLTEAKKIYHSEKQRLVKEAAEKLGLAKERELFGKLVRAALLARSPTSSGAQRPAQAPQPRTSGYQQQNQQNQPQTQAAFELTRGQKKEIDKILGDLEDKGHDIRKITKEGDSVNSTGNAAADAALRALGFKVA